MRVKLMWEGLEERNLSQIKLQICAFVGWDVSSCQGDNYDSVIFGLPHAGSSLR